MKLKIERLDEDGNLTDISDEISVRLFSDEKRVLCAEYDYADGHQTTIKPGDAIFVTIHDLYSITMRFKASAVEGLLQNDGTERGYWEVA